MKLIQLAVLQSFLYETGANEDKEWGSKRCFIYKILLNYLMDMKA